MHTIAIPAHAKPIHVSVDKQLPQLVAFLVNEHHACEGRNINATGSRSQYSKIINPMSCDEISRLPSKWATPLYDNGQLVYPRVTTNNPVTQKLRVIGCPARFRSP